MEGTVSQIFYLGPSLNFMSKNGYFFTIFLTKFSRFYKIKTRALIKKLRHGSLKMGINYTCSKFY